MPLHVWLPRAHPIAPAHISALMSGVMIKIAVYGLVRVLVDWLGVLPQWVGVLVLALGALSAVAGVTYALFQHDLKRLLAFHSIENIGIIVLGLGACLLLRARGADMWAAFALAAALLHTVNHALFKALLFLGAGSFERVVGSLELDRLGGLLRRMPWTGGAFLVGALAIAGLPPLNGFASEWLTLQSLLHVPASGGVPDGVAGAIALAALASTAALAVFCFVKVVGLVLLGPPGATPLPRPSRRPPAPRRSLARSGCVLLGVAPGLLFGSLVGLAPWAAAGRTTVGLDLPTTGSLPTGGIAIALVGIAAASPLRGRRAAAPAPTWACGQLVERQLDWTSAGFTKPLRLVLEAVLRPQREIVVRSEGGVVREVSYAGRVPHLFEERLYRPVTQLALRRSAPARRLQSGRLGTYVAYLIGLVLVAARRPESGSSDERRRRSGRRRPARRVASCSRRPCRGSCSTGRHGCRDAAGRRRCSPTGICAGSGERPRSTSRRPVLSTATPQPSLPRASRPRCCSFPSRQPRPTSVSVTTRSRSRGCWRSPVSPWPQRPGMSRTVSR